MEALESQVYSRLEEMRGDIVKLTQEMVAFKSVNPRFMADPESSEESAVQDLLESTLKTLGLEVTRWEKEPKPAQSGGAAKRRGRRQEPGLQRAY